MLKLTTKVTEVLPLPAITAPSEPENWTSLLPSPPPMACVRLVGEGVNERSVGEPPTVAVADTAVIEATPPASSLATFSSRILKAPSTELSIVNCQDSDDSMSKLTW
jgi:hypothetical protein